MSTRSDSEPVLYGHGGGAGLRPVFAGDGINDAAALGAADVGLAMHRGSFEGPRDDLEAGSRVEEP